ncbi:MAG: LamG domain-containing protein, partial [Sedimentisphaerales bacterium]|nr:LamG domain-containing protein [Sedimentisphaerales bacterium]
MYKKMCLLTCFIVIVSVANIAAALDQPIAYYPMNDGSGTTVEDASGNGNDGTIIGALEWVEGAPDYGTGLDFPATAGNYVNCGTFDPSGGDNILTVSAWFKIETLGGYQCIVGKAVEESAGAVQWQLTLTATGQLGFNLGAGFAAISDAVTAGEWHHAAMTLNGSDGELFLDGVSVGTRTGLGLNAARVDDPVMIGVVRSFLFNGIIDEVALFHAALSQADIQDVMNGALTVKGPATGANPGNGAKDIPISYTTLTWKPGPFAYTHDVFFGTDFNDVNDSTVDTVLGDTIISPAQEYDANSYSPGKLEYGTTYYWRIDEANEAPDDTVFKGKVWSFTTEPEGIELGIENVVGVEAYSPSMVYEYQEPNTTYNGIGLDANDMHDTDTHSMW